MEQPAPSSPTAFPWKILARFRWAESPRAAADTPACRATRSTIVADLIALRRIARQADRGDARAWLLRHPACDDFLCWSDTAEGCVSRARAKDALGPILDAYLVQSGGEGKG